MHNPEFPDPGPVPFPMAPDSLRGGAAASVLSRLHGCGLRVIDVGVDADLDPHPLLQQSKIARGTANMLHADAMSSAQLQQALQIGRLKGGDRIAAVETLGPHHCLKARQ